ncbi:MAG: hypothetical protein RBU45_15970, partial [Myxococcota bacterium]|nr:hypothetical protein [Myxococcota bacterium]
MTSGRPRRAGEARGAGGPGWGAALLGGLFLLAAGCGDGAGEEGSPAPACTGPQCPPADPVCYSPCRDHLPRPDGTLAVCSSEGLLPGCLGGNVCVAGSCQPPGSDGQIAAALAADPIYPACLEDGQCPDFQRCLGGRCYSDCQQDGDCASPSRCRRHVCRRPCNTETDPCPEAEELCLAGDGQNGFCLPRGPRSLAGPPAVAGGFTVSERLLAFSNVRPGGFFWIGNESAAEVAFTVRKLRHTEHGDDGETVIAAHPLSWLQLGPVGELSQQEAVTFVLGPWEERELQVAGAVNPDRALDRWEGVLQIDGGLLGQRELALTYTSRADGQWLGSMYYFGSFRDEGLDAWLADGDRSHLQNALLSFWDEFKKGQRDLGTFRAMVDATIQETWRLPQLEEEEECAESATVCFPDDNAAGYTVFTQDVRHNPIPTGVVEFPFALNLRQDGSPTQLTGRIPTDLVLHYAGDPAVSLELGEDPATAAPNDAGVVLVPVTGLAATVLVGGRYLPADPTDGRCEAYADGSYALHPVPWLVEGFLGGTVERDGRRYRDECRDTRLPAGATAAQSQSQAAANPIPDGRTRERHLELVDGALVNQDTLLLLVRERFVSFLGVDDTAGFAAYALLLLERGPTDLEEEAYRGAAAVEERTFDDGLLHVGCSAVLLDEVEQVTGRRLDPDDLADALVLAQLVTEGRDSTPVAALGADGDEEVHWYCEDTGVFDGLVLRGGLPVLVPCPESSRVRYFATTKSGVEVEAPPGVLTLDIDDACEDSLVLGEVASLDPAVADALADTVRVVVEQRGECWSTLENWVRTGGRGVRLDPLWSCVGEALTCDGDRLDPRRGKLFYAAPTQVADCDETCCAELGQTWVDGACRAPGPAYLPAAAQLQSAFRYKTRFRSRRGENPGFVPEICQPGSDAIPYCYDPGEIESLARRVDCALYLRGTLQGRAPAAAAELRDFLRLQFAYAETTDEYNRVTVHDGFERLYAELLIMLGDEAYTAAFASRFDLAGSAVRSFEGELFEPTGGITLAGGAGHEMVMLYQATQYYGLALDRFYTLSPLVWQELAAAAADPAQGSYITLATVTAYFDRLIRASTQKARAWSEIGTRYAGFGRADLARQVVARAYTATYLESVVLSRMMLRMQQVVTLGDWPQISQRVELAQLGYRSALLAMREVYDGIQDERTYFGFPPDHVPFPALDPLDVNAFEKMLALAREQTATAAAKEELALAS